MTSRNNVKTMFKRGYIGLIVDITYIHNGIEGGFWEKLGHVVWLGRREVMLVHIDALVHRHAFLYCQRSG